MGRQFSYFCLPDDLQEIHAKTFAPLGGHLFASKCDSHGLVPVNSFAEGRAPSGEHTLSLVLAPPQHLANIVVRDSSYIDTYNSNVIEVSRCYTDGAIIRLSRFWYEPKTFRDGTFGEKSEEFVSWAQAVFRQTKRLLTRQTVQLSGHSYSEWVGKQAWEEISNERLQPVI